ncbi:MAG: Mur ligase domain-containing protein, partial [Clostridia bacterium]
MKLEKLLTNISTVAVCGSLDIEIDKIVFDSSQIVKNCMFVCLDGSMSDGHNFVDFAVAKGAVAVVCQKEFFSTLATTIQVKDTRVALSLLAINFFDNPSKSLKIVAVVGTNGKSSTAYITSKLLNDAGKNCGLIGTIYYEYNNIK